MRRESKPFVPPGEGGKRPPLQQQPTGPATPVLGVPSQQHTTFPLQELDRVLDDGFPITAATFDPVDELLWVSHCRGMCCGTFNSR